MKKLILAILISVVSVSVKAEPSSAFSYLMDEPTSMLEYGMFKIEKELNKLGIVDSDDLVESIHSQGRKFDVSYSWETNRLKLEGIFYLKKESLKKKSAVEYCKLALTGIRGRFGGGYSKNVRQSVAGISEYFKHNGFSKKNMPANFMDEIENAIIISVQIRSNPQNKIPFEVSVSCESPLIGDDIFIKQ